MKFSIVTPSFNQLDWLRLCVASVADQGAKAGMSIEHIVQDGGTRGIEEFAREHRAAFYRDGKEVFSSQCSVGSKSAGSYSIAIYSESDDGMYDAINKGLTKATGDVCAYLNCDEQYLPGTLAWVGDYFSRQPETDVLFGAAIVTKKDGSYVCDRKVMPPTRWHTMVSGNLSFFTSSTFFRRAPVVDSGILFDPGWRVVGDAVWALRLIANGMNMHSTSKALSVFAETGGNLSAMGNPRAAGESLRLSAGAPQLVRIGKHAVVAWYRVRRWIAGAYSISPHFYSIYTMANDSCRMSFDVLHPTFRWKLGANRS